jgi:hypothetical protein
MSAEVPISAFLINFPLSETPVGFPPSVLLSLSNPTVVKCGAIRNVWNQLMCPFSRTVAPTSHIRSVVELQILAYVSGWCGG